jgi:hypothetical protein
MLQPGNHDSNRRAVSTDTGFLMINPDQTLIIQHRKLHPDQLDKSDLARLPLVENHRNCCLPLIPNLSPSGHNAILLMYAAQKPESLLKKIKLPLDNPHKKLVASNHKRFSSPCFIRNA